MNNRNNCRKRNTKAYGRAESFVYQIVDISGKIVKTGKAKTDERIDVRGLVKGNYVLWIEKENGERQSLKLIKN